MKVLKNNQRIRWSGKFFAVLNSDDRRMKSNLNKLGLDYQKVKGLWDDENIIVWKTAYTYEQFKNLMLKLNAQFKQKSFCIGRKLYEEYDVLVYQTESLDDIQYKTIKHYCVDAKVKTIKFGKLYHNKCLETSECIMGAYKREQLIKNLISLKEGQNEEC